MKTCPACAEQIPADVESCPQCGISLHDDTLGGGSAGGGKKTSTLVFVFMIGGGMLCMLVVCGGILGALIMPRATSGAREAARRTQCLNNLKQIGLALHNYHDAYGAFPPAFVLDEDGKPMHSWRVLILPFLDEAPLYNQYDFSEPWDGPNNSRLLGSMPRVYACPSHASTAGNTSTAFAGVLGEHCVFRGAVPTKITEITDGTSNTLLVGGTSRAGIPWMKPQDIDVTAHPSLGDPDGFSSDHAGGVPFLLGDGSARFISLAIDPATLEALFSRDKGEVVVGDF